MSKKHFLLALLILSVSWLVQENQNPVYSNENGAPNAVTGSPGDNSKTCAKSGCHTGNAVVSVPGIITSNIPPGGYVPGTTYTITATCSQSGINKWGFEISPQDNTGNLLGQLVITNTTQTKIVNTKYVTHKTAGSSGSGSKTWSFNWVAPAAGTGDVTFYGSFNYANNNGSDSGDHIKTSTLVIPENSGTTGIAATTANENSIDVFPNPVRDRISIRYATASSGMVSIGLYDMTGQKVQVLLDEIRGPGQHDETLLLNGISTGVYSVEVITGKKATVKKVMVL